MLASTLSLSVHPLDNLSAESILALGPFCGDLNLENMLMTFLLKCDLRLCYLSCFHCVYQSVPFGARPV